MSMTLRFTAGYSATSSSARLRLSTTMTVPLLAVRSFAEAIAEDKVTRMVKEYRVWRRKHGRRDQRGSQGHYVIAESEAEAIMAVKKGRESISDYDALVWKVPPEGRSYYPSRLTPEAECFKETGDAEMCRRRR